MMNCCPSNRRPSSCASSPESPLLMPSYSPSRLATQIFTIPGIQWQMRTSWKHQPVESALYPVVPKPTVELTEARALEPVYQQKAGTEPQGTTSAPPLFYHSSRVFLTRGGVFSCHWLEWLTSLPWAPPPTGSDPLTWSDFLSPNVVICCGPPWTRQGQARLIEHLAVVRL